MKRLAIWLALMVALTTAAWLGMLHFDAARSAVRRFVSPGPLSPAHSYIGDRCASCHEPTVGVTAGNCTACHADDERLLGRQPTAFHASIEECASCHVEHQPTHVRPLVMDHVELARVGTRTLARASTTDPDSGRTLASLENWLRIPKGRQTDSVIAREALNCAGCHDRQEPHFKRFGSDCAQCHVLESWTVPGYRHPSPSSKQCVQCHQAPPSHFMEHFSMVSQKFAGKEHARVDQCFECHNTTSWNDIVGVGFYKHH